MRANEFVTDGIHKNTAMQPGDQGQWDMRDHSLSSATVNDVLHNHYRGKEKIDLRTQVGKHIKVIDKIISRFILTKPAKVYTGIPVSIQRAYEKYKADRSKPIRLHLPAYTSATTSLVQAAKFSTQQSNDSKTAQVLLIELPVGTPAVSIKNVSAYEYEKEVLLPRGMDIEVQPTPNVVEKNGKTTYIWQAIALGHSPIQIVKAKS